MISLHPLDRGDGARVAHIALRPDQVPFAGTVEMALAEPPDRFDLHEIRRDGVAVGLFKIDRDYRQSYGFACEDDLGLRAVMIDARAQNLGVGKAAMAALRDYLSPLYPLARSVMLTVNMANPAAVQVYLRAGFADTGAIWPHGQMGPQHIMRLRLKPPAAGA